MVAYAIRRIERGLVVVQDLVDYIGRVFVVSVKRDVRTAPGPWS
jgi:hypothetical protein